MTDAEEQEPQISESRMRFTALIIASALFMQNLDSTIITTALPAMARAFHEPPLHMSVALTSYLISLSVFIPASGWVADRFGARAVFRAAIIVFTLGSVLCGLAPSLGGLVAARIIQGLGGAMMLPVGRLVLLRSVSREQMVSAMSWLTMPALLGPILGPPLGGLIVSYVSWRWVFGINVPIGCLGFIAVGLFIPDIKVPGRGGGLDARGLILSGLAMAMNMIGLETYGRHLIPLSWTLGSFAIGLGAGALYIRHARHAAQPVLDLSLLRIPTFANSMLAGSLFRIAVGALPFLLPLMLQLGFGDTPLRSGLITFAAAAGALFMKPMAKPILQKFGFRTVLVWNGVLAAGMIAVCASFTQAWPPLTLDAVLFIGGLFRSLQFTAFNAIAYGDIPRARMSAATSFYSTIQQLSLTMGIVVGAIILEVASGLRHHPTALASDYTLAFLVVGLIALIGAPLAARLPANAGASLSGHRHG